MQLPHKPKLRALLQVVLATVAVLPIVELATVVVLVIELPLVVIALPLGVVVVTVLLLVAVLLLHLLMAVVTLPGLELLMVPMLQDIGMAITLSVSKNSDIL